MDTESSVVSTSNFFTPKKVERITPFYLSDDFIGQYEHKKVDWDAIGEFTYLRTYARWIGEGGKRRKEKWNECVRRIVEGCFDIQKKHCHQNKVPWNNVKAQNSAKIMFDLIFKMKFLPPGRGIWMMGTEYVNKNGSASLNNCSFTSTKNLIYNPIDPFKFVMDFSMLGVGLGFDTAGKNKLIIKKPSYIEEVAIIPDSREGWTESLSILLSGFFLETKIPKFDFSQIRVKGSPIRGFGGEASGSQPLIEMLESISNLLTKKIGSTLSSTDIVDIYCMIGKCVVSGNVRRSALLALGDADDIEFLKMKDFNLHPDECNNYRWASNNSVKATVGQDYNMIAELIAKNGEPGVVWLDNVKNYSRMKDPQNTLDYKAEGINPCAEVTLENMELCNLVETFPSRHDSYEEYKITLKYAYLYAKTVTLVPTHWEQTNSVMLRNRRIGTSQSGIIDAFAKHGRKNILDWCDKGYNYLKEIDSIYSDWLCIPKSIKISSVKPSGCQVKETLINTKNGIFRLDEIGDITGQTWQNINLETTFSKNIDKFYINGKVETKIITTEDGNELESSLDHKYKIYENDKIIWKRSKDIKIGDNLICSLGDYTNDKNAILEKTNPPYHNCSLINQPEIMDEKLAWLIGLLYGNGSVHEKGLRISFNRKQSDLILFISNVVKDLFNITTHIDNETNLYINSTWLLEYLKKNRLLKSFCEEILIPKSIRTSSIKVIKAFITGFWRADGGIHNGGAWSVCTVSKRFALEFLSICRAVGINLKIKNAGPGGWGSLDRWIVSSRNIGTKNDRYISNKLKARIINNSENYNTETLWLDKIVDISSSENNTYDISVPEGNTYVANGVISHNTVSILAGVSPGIHYPHSEYYIRRVTVSSDSLLVNIMKNAGYNVIKSSTDKTAMLVEFPIHTKYFVKGKKEVTMWEQLLNAADYQRFWSDNQVSITVTFKKEEARDIANALSIFDSKLKGVSMLPMKDHGYKHPPYEEITADEYEEIISKIKTPDYSSLTSGEAVGEKYCDSDKCVI